MSTFFAGETLLTLSLAVMRRRVLDSRLANVESPIVTARVQIGLGFFYYLVLFCLIGWFVFVIVVVFHTQDPLNVYVQIFAPCKD